ncbi:MAG TPA: transketolase family protein [Bacillota bacterium]|nr:transketolase family protein [Bacillota bacterium]
MGDKIATRDAYGNALLKLGKENPDVVVLDADLSKSTKTAGFSKAYPERFFQMGIAEADMMTTAAGFATCGKTPFASTFAIFATGRAYDQVRNSIGYPHLNVKIAATHAGITVGEDGGSHQSIEDLTLMRAIPGMVVLSPADAVETEKLILKAAEYQGPVYIRLGREPVSIIFDEQYQPEIGKAVRLREGDAATIVATGVMVEKALAAADRLKEDGLNVRVVNVHTIKPLDEAEIVAAAKETGAIVTAEEHSYMGGLSGAVAEVIVRTVPVPMEFVAVQDRFGQSGKPSLLMEEYGLTVEDIVNTVKKVMKRK